MITDFKKINFDAYGNVDHPTILLKTLDGEQLGYLGLYTNLKLSLRYSDVSEVTFDIPSYYFENNEKINTPCYNKITGMKTVYIHPYGTFILMSPTTTNDGTKEIKSCKGYSLEYEINHKKIFIPEGTYNFYNPVSPKDTMLDIIKELLPNWNLGDIDSELIGKYRTFSKSDDNLYSFMMNTLQQTYNCLFIFNSDTRTIDVISTNKTVEKSPIYLSFDNLIKETEVTELTDEVVSVLNVYGADPVTIRNVNPMGNNKIYNLDYFIENGDVSSSIAEKWRIWKENFDSKQSIYTSLIIDYNITLSNLISERANLTQLNEELFTLEQLQSEKIEGLSYGSSTKHDLNDVKRNISNKKLEIKSKENDIKQIETELETANTNKTNLNDSCKFSAFFTSEELNSLDLYFKEESLVDDTFVLSTVNYNNDNISRKLNGYSIQISGDKVNEINVNPDLHKRIFDFRSSKLNLTNGSNSLKADIVNVTLEVKSNNEFLMTCFLNRIEDTLDSKTNTYPSGDLSIKGTLGQFLKNNTSISFDIISSISFLQFGATEYQQQTIEKELYDYAVSVLKKSAYPSYEFSIESGNILFSQEFQPFKDNLKLGNAIYLNLDNDDVINPILLEINIDYEKYNNFSMVFSNKFKLHDKSGGLVDLLGKTVTTSNSVNFNKYNYSAYKDSGAENNVKQFMESALDVAKNAILSSSDQAISWDNSGFHLRKWNEDKTDYLPEQAVLINNSIVLTDDAWNTAKLAIGKFVDENLGSCWGVVAPNITGTLLAGNNLVLESDTLSNGVAQFKFDSTGAFLNNSRMYLQSQNGKIGLDPNFGIIAGTENLFNILDTGIMNPTFIDTDGSTIFDDEGFPLHTNFAIGIDGKAYFRGKIHATEGFFRGRIEALEGIFKGRIEAEDGYFRGIVQAGQYLDSSGRDMFVNGKFQPEFLNLLGLNINDRFIIDSNGNVTINGGSISWGSVVGTDELDNRIGDIDGKATNAQSEAELAKEEANLARREAFDAQTRAEDAIDNANEVDGTVSQLISDIGYTRIGEKYMISPYIEGGVIKGGRIESDTIIEVETDVKVGKTIVMNQKKVAGGIKWMNNEILMGEILCNESGRIIAKAKNGDSRDICLPAKFA